MLKRPLLLRSSAQIISNMVLEAVPTGLPHYVPSDNSRVWLLVGLSLGFLFWRRALLLLGPFFCSAPASWLDCRRNLHNILYQWSTFRSKNCVSAPPPTPLNHNKVGKESYFPIDTVTMITMNTTPPPSC
jgi:hypothetical protein